jgi:serine/threonine protein kinase
MFNDDSLESVVTEDNSRQSVASTYVKHIFESTSLYSSSATYPSHFPPGDAYAPVYVMRKLAFQPSDVDQGAASRRNSLRRHATPDFLLASPADRDFSQRQFQFSHRGSAVLSSPSPDLPSFHFAPPPWQRTDSMDSDYSGENESSLEHVHSSGEEYEGIDVNSTGADAVLDLYLSSAAAGGPQPRPSPQVSLIRRGSQDSLIASRGPIRLNRTLPATPRIVHHSLPPAGYTPAPPSGSLDTSLFLPGSAKHCRPFDTLCVDPFERKKRRVGSSSETSRFRNEFTEVELIGKGSFSDVFKVRNRIDGQYYAVKRLKKQCSNDSEKKTCEREASILSLLSHRSDHFPDLSCHIIRYYSSWFEEGRLFLQTELCDASVPDLINHAGGSLAEKTILAMVRDVAGGLKYLHAMELVHLDIKPANIFQTVSELGQCIFKIGDMGLVSPAGEPAEVTSGDARYLPREILLNNYRHLKKADIFSLGASILECMLGERLEAEGEEWHKLRDGVLPTDELIGYSKDLVKLVEMMLSPDPEKRPTCDEILSQSVLVMDSRNFPQINPPTDDVSPMSSGYPHDKENAVAKASPGKALMRSLKHTRQKLRKLFTAAT